MKITPQIFVTADTHLGHSKIWNEWKHRQEGFEEQIIANWNRVINKHDKVLHLGDLSLANKDKTMDWTKQLRGKKYLIMGNHDKGSVTWYRDCGFEVLPNAYQRFGQKDGSYIHVLFTHEPVDKLPGAWFNIHGHLHGDAHRGVIPDKVKHKYYDAGVDFNGLTPVKLALILEKLKSNQQEK